MELIDAHECLCGDCKSEYHDILRSTMVEEGKAIWIAKVIKETLEALKRNLITEYKEEFNSKALHLTDHSKFSVVKVVFSVGGSAGIGGK